MHTDWLAQIEISGPFLAEPVLRDAFPQGLDGLDPGKRKLFRQAYDEWREAIDSDDQDAAAIHDAWIQLVLRQGLELDSVLTLATSVAGAISYQVAEHDVTLHPDFVVTSVEGDAKPRCLVATYGADVSLSEGLKNDRWAASPAERMVELCRAVGTRIGLVTNGELWTLIDAPPGGVTSFATWHARLWGQEPVTLQAFINLLGVRRFFVDEQSQLPALFDRSLEHQDDVTEALGEQVRRAVEVLIQTLDRADADRDRELLQGLQPRDIYEAALTVMMRIVFLLSAEERGLLLMGDERYEANYAVSTLRQQLRNEPSEILERRWDAWSRLLSVFRVVYGGVEHEAMRLPALGGSLFDPDRFAFLEGRAQGTHWKTDLASPLPIDNRTVLLLLDAVQLFQGRTLSYRALDVEQIGHVYEGLLERTVARAEEVTLDLDATRNAKNPWVTLPELDAAKAKGSTALAELLKERTGSAASRITNDLARAVDDASTEKLLTACQGDQLLRDRLKPYFHLIRTDRWGYPLVYPKNSFMVASGSDRREAGAHYTPRSLTEIVVKKALEPIIYTGPAEGWVREKWELASAAQLLAVKVCDPGMGSGAFLVQTCRYLADRVVEAWAQAESLNKCITAEGAVVDSLGAMEPLPRAQEERAILARRLVAERCLYGVDTNPLAVELAKLSVWLVTLARNRPFGFLDHNLKCGDSLLGITSVEQLSYLDLSPDQKASKTLFAAQIEEAVAAALKIRLELRNRPILDIRDVEAMAQLDRESRHEIEVVEQAADAFVGEVLNGTLKNAGVAVTLSVEIGGALDGAVEHARALTIRAADRLRRDLPLGKTKRRPLHWPLAFPEVFTSEGGFHAVIGNPPFLGGKKISTAEGTLYRTYLSNHIAGEKGAADLCAFFFLRARSLIRANGVVGFLATNSIGQGGTREVGLAQLEKSSTIFSAISSMPWPGAAGVDISIVHMIAGAWLGLCELDGEAVTKINSYLAPGTAELKPEVLQSAIFGTKGTYVHGEGFVLSDAERRAMLSEEGNAAVLQRYLVARDLTTSVDQMPTRWVINFGDRSEEEAKRFSQPYLRLLHTVKPERDKIVRQVHETAFWKHWDRRDDLYEKIRAKRRVLVCPEVSKHSCFAFLPSDLLFSHMVNVVPDERMAVFAILQSSIHTEWAWQHGSTLQARLRYTTSGCLSTFPQPDVLADLEAIGQRYYDCRKAAMDARGIGLTKIYDLLSSPVEVSTDIILLRTLQAELDVCVLRLYGWSDIKPLHDFHSLKRGVRYAIDPDSTCLILERLLKLNRERFNHPVRGRSVPLAASKRSGVGTFDLFDNRMETDSEPSGG